MTQIPEEFLKGVKIDSNGCWEWIGPRTPMGYGTVRVNGRNRPAHRMAYEYRFGKLPDKLVVDHLCRNRACINTDHLEAVTDKVNVLRGIGPTAVNARKTHCIRGHEFTPENTQIIKLGRVCKACKIELQRTRRAKARASKP